MPGRPRRLQRSRWVAMLLLLPLVLGACDGGADRSAGEASSPSEVSSPAVCGYLYEMIRWRWRSPASSPARQRRCRAGRLLIGGRRNGEVGEERGPETARPS
jgi:hypothetical protein